MEVQAIKVMSWVNANLPPLSWNIIVMQNMKVFMKYNVFPSKIANDTKFNAEIIATINASIKERYKKELPSTLS